MNKLLPLFLLLCLRAAGIGEQILPNLHSEELIVTLREQYRPRLTLSYREARLEMFTRIDNENGNVTLVYTGRQHAAAGIPNGNVVNTEHTWPQSHFENAPGHNMMKCDLHHLFPTESTVNSRRGNNAFGDINDEETLFWYNSNLYQTQVPSTNDRDRFSEATNSLFEPREAHKGNAARALFYFYTIYGGQRIDHEWFRPQVATLLGWNEQDPPDQQEVERSRRISETQGNQNPFVLDATLAGRVFSISRQPAGAPGVRRFHLPLARAVPLERRLAQNQNRIRIAHWNAHEVFSIAEADAHQESYRQFGEDVRADIVTINEFTSREELQRLASHMRMGDGEIAWSDFVQNDDGTHGSFEVGVISRFPITSSVEFDLSPDNVSSQGDPEEVQLVVPEVRGLATTSASRGFLRVQIEDLRLLIYVTHLKSSQGASGAQDRSNAQKREIVAAAISRQTQIDAGAFPDYTLVVAGDMNVGETDVEKNGTNLTQDRTSGAGDRYDDTHAIFALGLVGGPRLQSKTRDLGLETFNSPDFPGVGPIDCIYVHGPAAVQISAAQRGPSSYHSDHFPVWVDWNRPVNDGGDDVAGPVGGEHGGENVAPNASLRIGAWNIENLGTKDADSNNASVRDQTPEDLAAYILASKVEVLALEEIHDDEQSNSDTPGNAPWQNTILQQALDIIGRESGGEWKYTLTAPGPSNQRQQMTGVAWNSRRATLLRRQLLQVTGGAVNGANVWARLPEAFHFSGGNGQTDFVLIPLHMKSNTDGAEVGRQTRQEEARQLHAVLPALRDALGGESDILILGDTNMLHGETTAADIWGATFRDLNADERFTYIKPFNNQPPPPFDRIFVPANQREFSRSSQAIHGPYGDDEDEHRAWQREHLKKRSDHLLIWTDIHLSNDDD